jgi:hypothetical protein
MSPSLLDLLVAISFYTIRIIIIFITMTIIIITVIISKTIIFLQNGTKNSNNFAYTEYHF